MNIQLTSACLLFLVWTLGFSTLQAQGGYALDCDGVDDYVTIPDNASLRPTAALTVEAWIYPEDIAGQTVPPVVRKADGSSGYALEINHNTNEIQFWVHIAGTGFFSSPTYTLSALNRWYHVAGTYDGSNITLYVNGMRIGSTVQSGTITSYFGPLIIGSESTFGGRYFDGKIDEVRIWSDARSQTEIQENMHRELTGTEANLTAYYPMNTGSGTTLTDQSTSANNGTLTNGPVWQTSGAHGGPGMGIDFVGIDDHLRCVRPRFRRRRNREQTRDPQVPRWPSAW